MLGTFAAGCALNVKTPQTKTRGNDNLAREVIPLLYHPPPNVVVLKWDIIS